MGLYAFLKSNNAQLLNIKIKTLNTYIIMKILKESYIKEKRIVITPEDCENIEILNNLWHNAISSINLNLSNTNQYFQKGIDSHAPS